MKRLKFVRTFKEGISNFLRNGSLTFVTVTVLSISLYAMSATLLYLYMAYGVMAVAQDKVNVNVYFKQTVDEARILEAKTTVGSFEGVKYVNYKSKEDAFEELKAMAETDESIKGALEAIDWKNPLDSFLVIGAAENGQYEKIIEQINNSFFSADVDYTNFNRNREDIERISAVIKTAKKAGVASAIAFVVVGILITFNTIKLTIYAHKQEFEVMRLVGASNIYIRLPFIFEGVFYGMISGLVVLTMLFATAYFIRPLTQGNIAQGDSISLFLHHFLLIFVGVFGAGIALGAVSSFIAIRKYLKI